MSDIGISVGPFPEIAAAVLGYLLGSIPFGLLLTRMAGLGDIRKIGSGNIGATNVLRTGNKGLALATLLLEGGKGVATALGTLLALNWEVGLLCCLTWLVVAFVFRYSSLSALLAIALSPVYALFLGTMSQVWFGIGLAILVWLRHHENIRRLLKGEEPKIGKKKPVQPDQQSTRMGHNGGPTLT